MVKGQGAGDKDQGAWDGRLDCRLDCELLQVGNDASPRLAQGWHSRCTAVSVSWG